MPVCRPSQSMVRSQLAVIAAGPLPRSPLIQQRKVLEPQPLPALAQLTSSILPFLRPQFDILCTDFKCGL